MPDQALGLGRVGPSRRAEECHSGGEDHAAAAGRRLITIMGVTSRGTPTPSRETGWSEAKTTYTGPAGVLIAEYQQARPTPSRAPRAPGLGQDALSCQCCVPVSVVSIRDVPVHTVSSAPSEGYSTIDFSPDGQALHGVGMVVRETPQPSVKSSKDRMSSSIWSPPSREELFTIVTSINESG